MTMQNTPLLMSKLMDRGAWVAPGEEIVTKTANGVHRQTYADARARAHQLAWALKEDGIEIGDMLAVFTPGGEITDRTRGQAEQLMLPDERTGLVMVVRSFDRVSYALIMESERPIHLNDIVTNP